MKKSLPIAIMLFLLADAFGQERIVNVDFESSSFKTSPTIPFDQPFIVRGEVYREVEYVEIQIFNENSDRELHTFFWNREQKNQSESFEIVVPGILISNSKYDFQIVTYKLLSQQQISEIEKKLRTRVIYYLGNNLMYDGTKVKVNKPQEVYDELNALLDQSLKYLRSKNSIMKPALSNLVYEELKRYSDFKFRNFLHKDEVVVNDSVANQMIDKKIHMLADLVMSEVSPYLNSDVVQLYRMVKIKSVSTDKEKFTLPINAGMYAWSKSVDINNTSVNNIDFTPGIGFTLPFSNKSSLFSNSRLFDSFGYSMGVLLSPVTDASGVEFITPGINLPVYAGVGFRIFKVVRFNAGAFILAEKGVQDFSSINVLPTAGLALELNLWMGIKK